MSKEVTMYTSSRQAIIDMQTDTTKRDHEQFLRYIESYKINQEDGETTGCEVQN